MAFPCAFYNSEPSFNSLFRLLDDFDKCSRQNYRRVAVPQWQPKFNIRETSQAYEFNGEFADVNKDDIHIKFVDPQTMVVYGKKEHTSSAPSPSPAVAEEKPAINNNPIDEVSSINASVVDTVSETSSKKSYQATVEDCDDDEFESVSSSGMRTPDESESECEPEKTKITQEKRAEVAKTEPVEVKPASNAEHCLPERSVSEFSRSFHFPTRVDHKAVAAKFKDGILSISIPKARRQQVRFVSFF